MSVVVVILGVGSLAVSAINAGNPDIFQPAEMLGYQGTELPGELNADAEFLHRCEQVRSQCTVRMGLADTPENATRLRPHTPKLAFVSRPQAYQCSSGKALTADDFDMTARILSMGKVHHAMTGTGGVGLAAAASIEGTVVQQVAGSAVLAGRQLRVGHPSGLMAVGATAHLRGGEWTVEKVTMSRSARRLMEGWVLA
jgi:2-methylaconitate cis-trans-isomerase PrpF